MIFFSIKKNFVKEVVLKIEKKNRNQPTVVIYLQTTLTKYVKFPQNISNFDVVQMYFFYYNVHK